MNITFPFLPATVGDKYISQIFLFILATSSITSRSRPSPTRLDGLSADIPSTIVPHLKRIYKSFSDALSISFGCPITIRCQISRNIKRAFLYDIPTTQIRLFGCDAT